MNAKIIRSIPWTAKWLNENSLIGLTKHVFRSIRSMLKKQSLNVERFTLAQSNFRSIRVPRFFCCINLFCSVLDLVQRWLCGVVIAPVLGSKPSCVYPKEKNKSSILSLPISSQKKVQCFLHFCSSSKTGSPAVEVQ